MRQKIDTNVNVRFGNADNYFKTNNQLTLEKNNYKIIKNVGRNLGKNVNQF